MKFNVCIMLCILMTPHVHIWMVYIVKMQFQMPMHMYIDSNNKYIQQNWIHSHQLYVKCPGSNECIHTHSNLAKSGIWSIDCEIWDMGYWGVKNLGYGIFGVKNLGYGILGGKKSGIWAPLCHPPPPLINTGRIKVMKLVHLIFCWLCSEYYQVHM